MEAVEQLAVGVPEPFAATHDHVVDSGGFRTGGLSPTLAARFDVLRAIATA